MRGGKGVLLLALTVGGLAVGGSGGCAGGAAPATSTVTDSDSRRQPSPTAGDSLRISPRPRSHRDPERGSHRPTTSSRSADDDVLADLRDQSSGDEAPPGAATGEAEGRAPQARTRSDDPPTRRNAPDGAPDPVPAGADERSPRRPPDDARMGRSAAVEKLLLELQTGSGVADAAFRRLWEIDARLIPPLILEVDNAAPSAVRELLILVLNEDTFAEDVGGDVVYRIPGMGILDFDDIAAGKAPSGRGYKVKLRRRDGFSVGVVVRAGLINRFRSTNYPPGDGVGNLVAWWKAFYGRVREEL